MKPQPFFVLLPVLMACAPATPIVSEFNGDSVSIQMSAFADPDEARIASLGEANRICGRVGKRAEYASTRQITDYDYEQLFLCL